MMDGYPTAGSELPATDSSALDRLKKFGGDKLLGDMIALFLATAPERIDAARAAGARGDVDGAERALHSLRSSAAQLGALHLQRLSEQGERRARAGSLDGLTQLAAGLEQELARVRAWLIKARDEGAA